MLKEIIKKKLITRCFKVSAEDLEKMKDKARKYTKGNLSAWIIYSAINLDPKKEDLTQ